MDPDLELLDRWRGGDKQAGGRLLTKYFPALRSYFKARVPELDQEDLIQDVFARMVSAKDRYEGRSSVRTYLFSIAKYVYREALRKRYRSNGAFDPLRESVADVSGRSQSSILARDEERQLLLEALRTISSDYQDLLELHYFHGLTYPQLGEVFEIPEGTAKSRASTARKALRERYTELLGRDVSASDVEQGLTSVRDAVARGEE